MVIDLILAVAGVGVLLLLSFGGRIAAHGRKSDQLLVAPRGARFGDASRMIRKPAPPRLLGVAASAEAAVVRPAGLARSDRHAA
jgi:hypothetical protein